MYEKQSSAFVRAIKTIAEKPENLDNLESYLAHHFPEWLSKYASTPDGIVFELAAFADMEI